MGDSIFSPKNLILLVGTTAVTYFTLQGCRYIDFFGVGYSTYDREKKELARKLKRPELETLQFSAHEMNIALDVICSDDIDTSFEDMGGMAKEIEIIMDNVIIPFKFWKEECDQLLARRRSENVEDLALELSSVECHVPAGLLMYGRPGTGKSMLARAIAKEAGASFIGVKSGTILDKYVGESDKLVAAVFSLAQKIAPTVIFIDEIDTLLKKRESMQSSSSSNMGSMLGSLMSQWDGLNSKGKAPVIVLGATNRPNDIDPAFLRRMPLTIQTQTPDFHGRMDIFKKILKNEKLGNCVDFEMLAATTEEFTGSDIREVCRLASIQRMKAIMSEKLIQDSGNPDNKDNRRPLKQVDFDHAVSKILQDGKRQKEYSMEQSMEELSSSDFASRFIRAALARSQNPPEGQRESDDGYDGGL